MARRCAAGHRTEFDGGIVPRTIMAALLWAAGTAVAPGVAAQDSVRRVSLDEALALFGRHNLELRIARAGAAAATARARQAAAYPNPTIGVTHETLNAGAGGYDETYLTLAQQIRWPWESAARGRAAAAEREAAAHRVAGDSLRLAFDVKRRFAEAASAERVHDGLAEATAVVRGALEDATHRAAEGDLSGYALRRLRVERARYEADLSAAVLALQAARRRLGTTLLPGSTIEIAPTDLPADDPPEVEDGTASPPEFAVPTLAAARAALDAARADEQAVRRGRMPAPAAIGGYKSQSDGLTGAFLGLSLPLPLFDRRSAAAAEAGAATARADAHLALVRRHAEDDVRLAVSAYQAARARARLFAGELLAEPEALLRIAQVAYAEGEMSLVELLDAVDAYRAARVAAVEARRDLWISFFDLERAAGGFPAGSGGDR
jgi:cobalt-zinc-cadmium efflux system outer membrane protein